MIASRERKLVLDVTRRCGKAALKVVEAWRREKVVGASRRSVGRAVSAEREKGVIIL